MARLRRVPREWSVHKEWTPGATAPEYREGHHMHLICDYIIPCVLCEEPLDHVTIYRNPASGREESHRERLPHLCEDMKALIKEGR